MYRSERWPDEEQEPRSRSSSRRSSASLSRRSSLKKDKKSPLSSAPASASSTPKKTVKPQNLDFLVTGKQILKKSDRANSLPGSCHRRQSTECTRGRRPGEAPPPGRKPGEAPPGRRPGDAPPRPADVTPSPKSHETSLDDDMSLDLSQVSDFEDMNSKYGIKHKFQALATSTPKQSKPRSASLQSQLHSQRVDTRRALKSLDSTKQSFSCSRDSFKTTSSSSPHRYGTELDYSSVSPEYSGQSSAELSPAAHAESPRSQDLQLSSCCVSTWAECSVASTAGTAGTAGTTGSAGTAVEPRGAHDGEWCSFWANYNNSLPTVPIKGYYDQCPTPYRTETFDLADFELADGSRKRSPDNVEVINNIIRNQGLHLTPRETQNIIKCAHLLGNVLSKAIERRSQTNDPPELFTKKKTMTLDLKETSIPLEVQEEKKCETAQTQTDISLPNTKSAPRIFENILRQLSRSSIDVDKIVNKEKSEVKTEVKNETSELKDDVKKEEKNEIKKDE